MKLNEKAILVAPILRKWNPRKVDKRLTAEMADKYGVDSRMIRASKKLVSLNEGSFKKLETLDKAIRNHVFYSVGQGCTGFCVPFDNKGWHLLPTELQDKFIARFNAYKDQRERHVKNIITEWSTIIETAKEVLKDMFDPLDYPSKEELVGLYECDYKSKTLNEEAYVGKGKDQVHDPRFGVSGAETAEVQSRERSSIELATEQATRNVGNLLTHLTDCLKEDKTFRDNSYTKVAEAIEGFEAWNFNNNEELAEVNKILTEAVANINGASDLRKDKDKADKFVEASDKATKILDDLEGVI
jgi:hypothetical protein